MILTSDKTAYAKGDTVTITIATDPPVSTDIQLNFQNVAFRQLDCFEDYLGKEIGKELEIQTNANGISTITGKIAEDVCYYMSGGVSDIYWDGGFHVYTNDNRFGESKLLITGK